MISLYQSALWRDYQKFKRSTFLEREAFCKAAKISILTNNYIHKLLIHYSGQGIPLDIRIFTHNPLHTYSKPKYFYVWKSHSQLLTKKTQTNIFLPWNQWVVSEHTFTQSNSLSFQTCAVRFTMKIPSPPPFLGIPVAVVSSLDSFSTPTLLRGIVVPHVRSPYSKILLLINYFLFWFNGWDMVTVEDAALIIR